MSNSTGGSQGGPTTLPLPWSVVGDPHPPCCPMGHPTKSHPSFGRPTQSTRSWESHSRTQMSTSTGGSGKMMVRTSNFTLYITSYLISASVAPLSSTPWVHSKIFLYSVNNMKFKALSLPSAFIWCIRFQTGAKNRCCFDFLKTAKGSFMEIWRNHWCISVWS